ncbi:sulfatase [Reticulomyxa filosa]|uniref:Sulfatase n=1 Tax=Reticulomyxa filosa TaxID=46433 RepID=X6P2E4_RETFI|nr:sulfatase [Reticulomyxa filosa]|eukprot:ETO32313.1 sulfatase [Reticulomyxa filosa]
MMLDVIDYLLNAQRHKQPFFLFVSYTTPHSGDVGDDEENGVPIPRIEEGPYFLFNNTVKGPTGIFWFIYLYTYVVLHIKYDPPPSFILFLTPKKKKKKKRVVLGYCLSNRPYVEVQYATAITWVDELTGTLLAALDQNNLTDNTVSFLPVITVLQTKGDKITSFLRAVNNIMKKVKWPAQIEAGQVSNYQWTFYDFLATALDLAQVNETLWPYTDGISMLPLLLGDANLQPIHSFIYHEYCEPNEDKQGWGQQVRIGNWTGLCIGNKPLNTSFIPVCNTTTFELYDLQTDLAQEKNLAQIPENAVLVQQMLDIMKEQHINGNYCVGA